VKQHFSQSNFFLYSDISHAYDIEFSLEYFHREIENKLQDNGITQHVHIVACMLKARIEKPAATTTAM
jgi:hypothetical protein